MDFDLLDSDAEKKVEVVVAAAEIPNPGLLLAADLPPQRAPRSGLQGHCGADYRSQVAWPANLSAEGPAIGGEREPDKDQLLNTCCWDRRQLLRLQDEIVLSPAATGAPQYRQQHMEYGAPVNTHNGFPLQSTRIRLPAPRLQQHNMVLQSTPITPSRAQTRALPTLPRPAGTPVSGRHPGFHRDAVGVQALLVVVVVVAEQLALLALVFLARFEQVRGEGFFYPRLST